MATGVLVLMVGEATKLASYLTAADKEYECEILLGIETDSFDADGAEISRKAPPADWPERLAMAVDQERSRNSQVPPAVSAVHVDGERAYDRARRGETVVIAARDVAVRSIDATAHGNTSVHARLVVSKGYYVRAFARDLAEALGTVGHLTMLRRLRSGPFEASSAHPMSDLATAPLVTIAQAAALTLPIARLSAEGEARARVGKTIEKEHRDPAFDGVQAWLCPRGDLVAIAEVIEGVGRVRRGFTGTS